VGRTGQPTALVVGSTALFLQLLAQPPQVILGSAKDVIVLCLQSPVPGLERGVPRLEGSLLSLEGSILGLELLYPAPKYYESPGCDADTLLQATHRTGQGRCPWGPS
jgi:hypothetical protein